MTLVIPEDILQAAKLDERTLLIEMACHLFDKGRLTRAQAARMAGLDRGAFEDELHDRKIPAYRLDVEDFAVDLRTLEHLRRREP